MNQLIAASHTPQAASRSLYGKWSQQLTPRRGFYSARVSTKIFNLPVAKKYLPFCLKTTVLCHQEGMKPSHSPLVCISCLPLANKTPQPVVLPQPGTRNTYNASALTNRQLSAERAASGSWMARGTMQVLCSLGCVICGTFCRGKKGCTDAGSPPEPPARGTPAERRVSGIAEQPQRHT